MAKVPFNSENKSQSVFDFPKLSLAQGEKARVVLIDDAPEMEYVHTLRTPKIENGKAVLVNVKQRDGSFREEVDHDFVGRFICLGNMDVLTKNNGLDVRNCPLCERAESAQAFDRAQRRFAMHVVKYKTKPGTFKVQEPFGAELVVWAFTDRVFNQITDMGEEHGDLRTKDLMLGPCENKQFQKFDINIGGSAEWLKDDDRKQYVKTLVAENKIEDLVPIIARKVTRDALETEIARVESKVRQADGKPADEVEDLDQGDDIDLDGLLGDDDSPDTEIEDEVDADAEVEAEVDVEPEDEAPDEVPDEVESKPKKKPAKKAAKKKAEPEPEEEAGSIEDLDDLLAGL